MEDWQINNIRKNLPKLQSWTNCNPQLLAILQAENVLSEDDIQAIKCEKKPNSKAEMLYNIMTTRRNAYYILTKAIIETKQTGAAEILLEIPDEKISKLQVFFLGNQHCVESLLNPDQIKSIQSWLQQNASLEELLQIHKIVWRQEDPMQLLIDTIPEPDPLYIPRFLICRQVVNPKLFQQECPDVFVFKDADWRGLRNVISSYGIEYSSRQLLQRKITVRFLILDVEANWIKICSKVNNPVHLIRYEKEIEKFLLEETSGDSSILREYLEHNQEVEGRNMGHGSCNTPYTVSENADASNKESEKDLSSNDIKKTMYAEKSEDEDDNVGIFEELFVKKIMEQNVKCIGICDLPGMGKSYLLASLARKINAEYPGRIVAFIQLQNLKLSDNTCSNTPENAQLQLMAQLATSKISQCILLELVKCKRVELELFFDGLDEVQETNLESLLVFFQTLARHMPETRIFVTSRPVLQAQLEKALRVIAYDIKPFNTGTQLKYLVTQWTQAEPDNDVAKLRAYAQFCLSSFEKFLGKKKSPIIGIPLQCKLIADVYSREAGVYANKNCEILIELPHKFTDSLFEIYSKFIRRQLGSGNCNFACFHKNDCFEALCIEECLIRNFHVLQAVRLIFPHLASFLIENYVFNSFDDLDTHKIFSPGILKQCLHEGSFEFVHRTFAEYLVAEYFWKGILLKSNASLTTIQRAFFENMHIIERNEGLTYFLDCMITESQKKIKVLSHCTVSASPVIFGYAFFVEECIISDYTGLLELCFKATENHKLNGKSRPVRSFWFFNNTNCSKPAIEWQDLDGKYERSWFSETYARTLLEDAAVSCSATTFDKIYKFFIEVLQIDIDDFVWPTSMDEAIKRADFELVQYFSKKMSLENHGLLYKCLQRTYFDPMEQVEKKLDIATFLLTQSPNLLTETWTEGSSEYKTPIHAEEIHLELLKFLVQRGCDILVPNCNGYSIVYSAAKYMSDDDFFELCRFICFECNARDYFLNPANWVEYMSNFTQRLEKHPTKSLFRILCNLELETVFVQNNPFLGTPKVFEKHMEVFHSLIYSAFKAGKLDFANLILSLDSYLIQLTVYRNIKLHGTNLLNYVTALRKNLLLSSESNIFAVSSKGETILHLAARTTDSKFFYAILCMLGKLWDETQDIKDWKVSNLHAALSSKAAPENLPELFNWQKNWHLKTPLHYAVEYLKDLPVECIDILLSCGKDCQANTNEFTLVDINAVNKYGNNAIFYAIIGTQRLELVGHLVNRGADWTVKDTGGCNITHICAATGRVDHLKYFVELGSDVNQPDRMGNNALQCAMKCTFFGWGIYIPKGRDPKHLISEIVQVLIDAGVNKTHKNRYGKSAYDYALDGKYPKEVLNMLK